MEVATQVYQCRTSAVCHGPLFCIICGACETHSLEIKIAPLEFSAKTGIQSDIGGVRM
eukprot:CAMPEP_0172684304 /NCGR_PEP_ID=MMETSP1074-20121228/19467_1 /TAXON_ID=2916 /ORGANISM="Ceratium fusus, Strain PA161109" /LENGTH=57 /DNA_ID=CAMNT_0013503295 /DNA_START=13 /DNA_END=186 /DNA_ORIENTATION=+